ncbi:MAG: hypothetical protein GDA51_08955 [Ekhidna sp.]|nr:hypothetical protein [Ekhidna sp.]
MEVFVVPSFRWLNLEGFSFAFLRTFWLLPVAWRPKDNNDLCFFRRVCVAGGGNDSIRATASARR